MKITPNKPSSVKLFRDKYLKKGIELININSLLEAKVGNSGWCNNFDEPEEDIAHLQLWYRDECVANVGTDGITIIDEKRYVLFADCDGDFIIFRKVLNND